MEHGSGGYDGSGGYGGCASAAGALRRRARPGSGRSGQRTCVACRAATRILKSGSRARFASCETSEMAVAGGIDLAASEAPALAMLTELARLCLQFIPTDGRPSIVSGNPLRGAFRGHPVDLVRCKTTPNTSNLRSGVCEINAHRVGIAAC